MNMYYEIYKDGELINTSVGDESFVADYCENNGYTYVAKEHEDSKELNSDTKIEERVCDLEIALAQTDETAIALFEAQEEQNEINAAQDDALIELYELIGG